MSCDTKVAQESLIYEERIITKDNQLRHIRDKESVIPTQHTVWPSKNWESWYHEILIALGHDISKLLREYSSWE